MTSRDFASNGGRSGSRWDPQDGPDIDVWNPASATGTTASAQQSNNQASYVSTGWSDVSQNIQTPPVGNLYQVQGDVNSDWRSGAQTFNSQFPQQYPADTSSRGFSQAQSTNNRMPSEQGLPNSYEQLFPPGLENVHPGYTAPGVEYYPTQYSTNLNSGINGSLMYGNNALPQHETTTFPNYTTTRSTIEPTHPTTFRNPLMDSPSNTMSNTEDLIRNLHIESEKTQKLIAHKSTIPCHIPQSSLAMLHRQLKQAAAPFSSPEALQKARERELGLHSIDDIGTTVVLSNLSAQAASFTPRSQILSHTRTTPPASEEEELAVLASLTKLVDNVQSQPGNFDNLSAVFVNQVRSFTHSRETVKEMVDMIFNKAILEDNFKYLGARLCDELTAPGVLNDFRSIFLKQLQCEFKKIQDLFDSATEKNIETIHGFITFLAEIFIHIKINGQPIIALGKSFARFLETILSKPAENVAFVCKMLKLTGAKLRDALSSDVEIYDRVFQVLKEYSNKQNDKDDEKSKRMLLLIASVLRLRDSNWGRTDSNTRKKSSIADPEDYGYQLSEVDQNYYMNEPVFFTPDGVQYTAAEAQIPEFYEQHLAKHNVKQDGNEEVVTFPWNPKDSYFDDFIPSDEEDELYKQTTEDSEFDEEFEKFLAESGQLH